MKMGQEKVGEMMVVTPFTKSLDVYNVKEFKNDIDPVLREYHNVVLDMSQVEFIDSTGLGAILSCLRKVKQVDGEVKLCGLSRSVRSLCELVRMDQILETFGSKDDVKGP